MRPDVSSGGVTRQLIASVARRRLVLHCAYAMTAAAAGGSAIVMVAALADRVTPVAYLIATAVGAAAAGLVLWRTARLRSPRAAALAIEAMEPTCLNVLVTAEELDRHPQRASPAVAARVFAEADRRIERARAADVVPLRRAWICLAAVSMMVPLWRPAARSSAADAVARAVDAVRQQASNGSVRVTIEPPAYTGAQAISLMDPERIEALEGSRIRVEAPEGWRVRFGDTVVSEVMARASAYFAVEDATGGLVRLIPVAVTPDRAPLVRVERPARDLLLPDGQRTIPVAISASDDLGLSMLELRYTKVSGSGEQFEFVEGSLPVRLERASERDWRADGSLALAWLNLGPGDSLVYRAVARDRRPGETGLASSDTYFLEIAGPGQIALEGVEMPSALERYAMSQQMIVLKLERLKARESTLGREALVEETTTIAAEQRTVRANFIFLLGGHVEDEEEEAEQSHEIQEGRLENNARKDIDAAISQMTKVGQELAAMDVPAALPPARAAVESLQRAFGRSRYLLRSLATRSRLDPGRRLTGALDDAADWRRAGSGPDPRDGDAVRRLLDGVLAVVAAARAGALPSEHRRRELAESALAVDPSASLWQEIARRLTNAQDAVALEGIAGDLAPLALSGLAKPAAIHLGESPLVRAFKMERRR